MASRRRPPKSYVEVPDSDSDEDFYIPESSISAQAAAESRLKRQKTLRGSEKNPSTSIRGVSASSKADSSLHSAVIDVDAIGPCAPSGIGKPETPNPLSVVPKYDNGGKSVDTVLKSGKSKARYGNDVDGSLKLDDNLNEESDDSGSDNEIQWRKRPQAVKQESAAESKPDSMQQPPANPEISERAVESEVNEISPKKEKPPVKYCDDSDGSFKIGDGVSDDDDSSSEFEIEAPKKTKAAGEKPAARSRAGTSRRVTPNSVSARKPVPRSDAAQLGDGKKRAVKYYGDSDGSYNMEDEVSDAGDSSSEFEMEAPKKTKSSKKKNSAQSKPVPLKKGPAKVAPIRTSALNGVQKPLSKTVKNGAGSTAGKRLGARMVLKPKLHKTEKSPSARQGQQKSSTPLVSSSGPRYRSGLSRKQTISTRLHSYLTPQ